MTAWNENDQLFRQQLQTGHRYATLVATHLVTHGLPAETTPMRWRASILERGEFANEYDVQVGPYRLDVKSRQLTFTTRDDYPYNTLFVYAADGWHAKTDKPHAIVLVSQITNAMLVIPVSTEPQWFTERHYDRVRDIEDEFYMAHVSILRPIDGLVAWLKARL